MVGCLSTLACSREVGKLSSTQALPSGRDLVKEGNSSLWIHMFYLVMHCVLVNSCNIYLQEQGTMPDCKSFFYAHDWLTWKVQNLKKICSQSCTLVRVQ